MVWKHIVYVALENKGKGTIEGLFLFEMNVIQFQFGIN